MKKYILKIELARCEGTLTYKDITIDDIIYILTSFKDISNVTIESI